MITIILFCEDDDTNDDDGNEVEMKIKTLLLMMMVSTSGRCGEEWRLVSRHVTDWTSAVCCTKCILPKVSIAQSAEVSNAQMQPTELMSIAQNAQYSKCLLRKMQMYQLDKCTNWVNVYYTECIWHNVSITQKCTSIHPMLKHTDLVWKQNAKVSNAQMHGLSECLWRSVR